MYALALKGKTSPDLLTALSSSLTPQVVFCFPFSGSHDISIQAFGLSNLLLFWLICLIEGAIYYRLSIEQSRVFTLKLPNSKLLEDKQPLKFGVGSLYSSTPMASSSALVSVFDEPRFRKEFNQQLFESHARRRKVIPEVGFNLDEDEYPQIME
ncbi:hypothetical protein PIB30_094369 [Stylosanthes scabra]|uniref:Uncharacterized protein n=1 Tax=Stylosanthes scabra TaxID=79078 RepID=A0ABU6TW31_9FABA|nr:hypothetical protein [Stylosanthes scabra]